jgi:hypothetical protein
MGLYRLNIDIIYLRVRKVQFREFLQVSDVTVTSRCKWIATLQ